MNIEITSDQTSAQRKSAEILSVYIKKNLQEGRSILLLVSGGSALCVLKYIDTDIFTNQCTVAVLDERFSRVETVNNYMQLQSLVFFKKTKSNDVKFIESIPYENEDATAFSDRLDRDLKKWSSNHNNGRICILQGAGPDGHTSGILPFPEDRNRFDLLFESDKWVTAYDAGNKSDYSLRATTTNTFLRNHVDLSVLYMTGNDKNDAYMNIISDEGSLNETPARIVLEMRDVFIITDIKSKKRP